MGVGGDGIELSWLVVSHDSARDLAVLLPGLTKALAALDAAPGGFRSELIVADNDSHDGSPHDCRNAASIATRSGCGRLARRWRRRFPLSERRSAPTNSLSTGANTLKQFATASIMSWFLKEQADNSFEPARGVRHVWQRGQQPESASPWR